MLESDHQSPAYSGARIAKRPAQFNAAQSRMHHNLPVPLGRALQTPSAVQGTNGQNRKIFQVSPGFGGILPIPGTAKHGGCMRSITVLITATTLFAAGISGVASAARYSHTGIASIYAYKGSRTASGQRASPSGLTAAHRTLPFGTHVRVTNRRNGRSVVVRINDRGPFVRGRIIDLTPAGARALGFSGLAPVSITVVDQTADISGE